MRLMRFGVRVIFVAVLLTLSGQPARAAEWEVFFEDHFLTSSLDAGAWNTDIAISGVRWCSASLGASCDPGQWQEVSSIPCSGLIQPDPYGLVTLSDGLLYLSAPSGRCFPYVWKGAPSRAAPFPESGDFAIEWRVQYSALNPRGTSIKFCRCLTTDPTGSTNIWCSPSVAEVYGGYYGGLVFGTRAGSILVPNQLQPHVYRVEYVDGEYSYFIDSILAATCVDTLRPNAILMGNPVIATSGSWSGFSIDYVAVSRAALPHDTPDCNNQSQVFQTQESVKISEGSGGFPLGVLNDGDLLGGSVAFLGDVNGDGIGDLAASAHADDDGGINSGAVWVLFMNEDGTLAGRHKISALEDSLAGRIAEYDVFGLGVEGLDDLDGDEVPDLVAGAENDGGAGRGAVWVLFLNADGSVKRAQKINETMGGFTGTLDDHDYFGNGIALLEAIS